MNRGSMPTGHFFQRSSSTKNSTSTSVHSIIYASVPRQVAISTAVSSLVLMNKTQTHLMIWALREASILIIISHCSSLMRAINGSSDGLPMQRLVNDWWKPVLCQQESPWTAMNEFIRALTLRFTGTIYRPTSQKWLWVEMWIFYGRSLHSHLIRLAIFSWPSLPIIESKSFRFYENIFSQAM